MIGSMIAKRALCGGETECVRPVGQNWGSDSRIQDTRLAATVRSEAMAREIVAREKVMALLLP